MKIEYLADYPEQVEKVNDWLYNYWGAYYNDSSKEDWLDDLKKRLNKAEIPTTFIALQEGKFVGTASLIKHDMDNRPELSPWLADVYVPPEHRKQGIASKLVSRVVEETRILGIERLYLFTRNAKEFYLKLGWELKENVKYHGKEVNIMYYDL